MESPVNKVNLSKVCQISLHIMVDGSFGESAGPLIVLIFFLGEGETDLSFAKMHIVLLQGMYKIINQILR